MGASLSGWMTIVITAAFAAAAAAALTAGFFSLWWDRRHRAALRRIEHRATEIEQVNTRVIENANVGIVTCAPDATILDSNTGFLKIVDRRLDEVVGYHPTEFIPEEDHKLVHVFSKNFEEESRDTYQAVVRHYRRDGELRWVDVRGSAIRDRDGTLRMFVVVLIDITDLHEAEEQNRRFSKVFMDSIDPIIIEDLDGNVIDMNTEAERSYGFTRAELIGRPIMSLVPPERHAQAADLLHRCKQGEYVRNIEGLRWNKDHTIVPVLLTLSALKDESGEMLAVATVAKDITDIKRAEAQLQQERDSLETRVDERTRELKVATERAEEATQAKADFLANMNHEIRTPMNAITGFAHLMSQTQLSRQQKNYLRKIDSATHNLLGLVNDILDFSKIEAGKLELDVHDFNLHHTLDNVATLIGIKAAEKGLELLVEDNEINQEVARDILESVGMRITIAEHGREAIDRLRTEHFDGVLMDVQMPVMDGYSATRKIRADARFTALPIIAMTANAMAADREKAIEAGMNDHVAKPIDVERLFRVLQ